MPRPKKNTDDIPTPPMGVEAAVPDVIVLPPPEQGRTCATCGTITADNACLVCGCRIGGDA